MGERRNRKKIKGRIGIADTTFSRIDMFKFVEDAIKKSGEKVEIERYTVPGFKDLGVACRILFEDYDCDIVIALGMRNPILKVCFQLFQRRNSLLGNYF